MKFLGDIDPNKFMFLNSFYIRRQDEHKTDVLYVILKNIETGEKFYHMIEGPTIDYYICKPEFRDYTYNKFYTPIKCCEKVTTRYKALPYDAAKHLGPEWESWISDCVAAGNYKFLNHIHGLCPYLFGSDIPIDIWYKIQYLIEYKSESVNFPITKQFMDIEVDGIHTPGFPYPGSGAPINAITLIDEESMTSYTLLLRSPNNDQINKFEDNIENFKVKLHETFDEFYGIFDYKFSFFDQEIDLIRTLFSVINLLKRDFVEIWNMDFDIPTIIERIKDLGCEPGEVMGSREFKDKVCYFYKSFDNVAANRTSYTTCTSYTTFLDQMVIYAGLRKGGGVIPSLKLNAIGKTEIGDVKLDYSEEANIKTLPYIDYEKFVMYNIKDVLLQFGIERKIHDLDELYVRALFSATPYNKAFRQTNFLKYRYYVDLFNRGYILGNNSRKPQSSDRVESIFDLEDEESEDSDKKFNGALVADPTLNCNTGVPIYGKRSSYVFKYVIDEDFSAMYPNTIITFNISGPTLIGKLILETKPEELNHFYELSEKEIAKWDAGNQFIEDFLCDNEALLGSTWFNLPTGEELVKRFSELKK